MQLNQTSVRVGLVLLFFLLLSYWMGGQPIPQPISITLRDNHIYVPIRINGRGPYQFRLESNVIGSVAIDNRLAKVLGLNIVGFQEIVEGTQRKRVFLVGIDKFSLGPITKAQLQVRVGDFNTTPQALSTDGVIGLDFFANHRLQFDGPANQLSILPDAPASQPQGMLTYATPYLVSGKIGSKDRLFNLDVGSAYTMLFPTAALMDVRYVDTPNRQVVVQTNPPFMAQECSITDELVLSAIHVTNQTVYYSPKVHQITVGVGFLKNHRFLLDQRRKLVKVE